MKTINLMCIEDAIKPKIRLKHYGGIVCLIDTGADTPVWCASIYKFLRLFPDATKTELKFIISGFGGDANTKAEVADVYKLPELKLGSIEEYIICKGMYVAISSRRNFGAEFILPYTIFSKSSIEINGLDQQRRVLITSKHKEIWLWYDTVKLTNEKKTFFKKYYHLTENEIQNNQFVENMKALVQSEEKTED